jgi:hypothetical protein
MELLLNLIWVLLSVPALWIWWRRGRVDQGQSLLALGCVLALLFPVISATDDIHAMRAEMEESSSSKAINKQPGKHRESAQESSGWSPAHPAESIPSPSHERFERTWVKSPMAAISAGITIVAGRAPPYSLPG